jgi:hypothetical protein
MVVSGGVVATNEHEQRFQELEARAADIRGYL